jgi:ElaB/YqjD/DUF883 family membrane-anchored ribosome-binding protein
MLRSLSKTRSINGLADIEQRIADLERQLTRIGRNAGRVPAAVSHAGDRVSDIIASALGEAADRFRGGARSVSGEASRLGNEASRLGNEAAKVGGDALRRVVHEVEQRPLATLAIVAGLGLLIGMMARRN